MSLAPFQHPSDWTRRIGMLMRTVTRSRRRSRRNHFKYRKHAHLKYGNQPNKIIIAIQIRYYLAMFALDLVVYVVESLPWYQRDLWGLPLFQYFPSKAEAWCISPCPHRQDLVNRGLGSDRRSRQDRQR